MEIEKTLEVISEVERNTLGHMFSDHKEATVDENGMKELFENIRKELKEADKNSASYSKKDANPKNSETEGER